MMKDHLHGRQFSSDDDVIQSADDFLCVQDKQFYLTEIQKLQKRWHKCIKVHGDYVGNKLVSVIILCFLIS